MPCWTPIRRLIVPSLLAVAGIAQAAGTEPVHGLIVRLKQPTAHADLLPRAGGAAERERALARSEQEARRWQRVLADASPDGPRATPKLRAVGRDQQLLDYGRPLARAEADAIAARLAARADVQWVEPNLRQRRLQVIPNDPLFGQQWWLMPASGGNADPIDARLRGVPRLQDAWASFRGRAQNVVAVVDTGITSHPDLDPGRILPGYDFVSVVEYANDGNGRDADPSDPGDWVTSSERQRQPALFGDCIVEDSTWHGTVVAGLIAATTDNATGVAGADWATRILPVRSAGKCGAEIVDIIDGMRWAAGLPVANAPANPFPARVINVSFGGSEACGPFYQDTIDELRREKGAIVVAAAGNEWSEQPTRPASCSGVVGVVALNRDGFKANYSNFGSALAATGIATVGGDDADGAWGGLLADSGLATLINTGATAPAAPGYAAVYGTSFASPLVSATISLMLGLNPALTVDQILAGLRQSARPHATSPVIGACSASNPGRCLCTTSTCGVGILDAAEALRYALNPAGYVAPARTAALIDNPQVRSAAALGADRPPNSTPLPPTSGGSGGGGALGAGWLLGLAAAVVALARRPRR